jgi:GNAT superfamily N-acetyltransferase
MMEEREQEVVAMVSIRKIDREDADVVFSMMRTFYDSPAVLNDVPDQVLKANIRDAWGDCPYLEGFVFEERGENHGQIVGYAMLAKSYSTEYGGLCIWVEDLYIAPQYRGKGIGSRFLSYADKLYEGTAVRFRLEVEKDNARAIEVYRKCGYSELAYLEMTKN